jgi:hypothetical protein
MTLYHQMELNAIHPLLVYAGHEIHWAKIDTMEKNRKI